jgi:DNA repair exonuclease SbcCD ATPase subunit
MTSYQKTGSINPYTDQMLNCIFGIGATEKEIDIVKVKLTGHRNRIHLLDLLSDLVSRLRTELVRKSVKLIETETNRYLETYFDAEIRVKFDMRDGDNLDVEIKKNGFDATFKQLSKGQRQMLKLSFAPAIMEATANKVGAHMSTLMFDEALEGLDPVLKLKAFNLFAELSLRHETVFVIDHDKAFQSLFDNKIHVTMINDVSTVTEE